MSLFSCIFGDIDDVLNQINQQANQIDSALNIIRTGFQPIQQGAWIGQGADAFMDEVESRLIPEILDLMQAIGGFGGGIRQVTQMIDEADGNIFKEVMTLADLIDRIY